MPSAEQDAICALDRVRCTDPLEVAIYGQREGTVMMAGIVRLMVRYDGDGRLWPLARRDAERVR